MRTLLKNVLDGCPQCEARYYDNVPLIIGESGLLTDEQVEAILVDLNDFHRGDHVR